MAYQPTKEEFRVWLTRKEEMIKMYKEEIFDKPVDKAIIELKEFLQALKTEPTREFDIACIELSLVKEDLIKIHYRHFFMSDMDAESYNKIVIMWEMIKKMDYPEVDRGIVEHYKWAIVAAARFEYWSNPILNHGNEG